LESLERETLVSKTIRRMLFGRHEQA
jgi:hypothetical protein